MQCNNRNIYIFLAHVYLMGGMKTLNLLYHLLNICALSIVTVLSGIFICNHSVLQLICLLSSVS